MLSLAELPGDRSPVASCSNVDGESGYVLKRDNGSGVVAREAEVYRALTAEPSMRAHLPRRRRDDACDGVLTLEHPPDAIDLGGYHQSRRRPPLSVAAAIGRMLAALHRLPLNVLPPNMLRPDVLPADFPAAGSAAARDLLRIVQSTTGFGERIDGVAATWSSVAPTHNNIGCGTILVLGKRPRVALVDWEAAGPGDPRWDVGAALAHYLTLWISSIPDTSLTPQRPLETILPAIRACWDGYARGMGMKGEAAQRFLDTTLPFAALRLVRLALESARASHRPNAQQMLHLQVAHNILERPHEAAGMLGLSEG